MKFCMPYIMQLFFALLFYVLNSNATVIQTSCEQIDVQKAISSAKDGDIIALREDTAIWKIPLVLKNLPSIIIEGMGRNCVIIDSTTLDAWESSPFWIYPNNHFFRITGLTFKGSGGTKGNIYIYGPCNNFRIDHCTFQESGDTNTKISGRSIGIERDVCGIIDHCKFIHGSIVISGNYDSSWAKPYKFGSNSSIFIENCYFRYTKMDNQFGFISGHDGCRWSLRHNTIYNAGLNNHGAETSPRAGMVMEVYNNDFIDSVDSYAVIVLRGGTGVIFKNNYLGYRTTSLQLVNYRSMKGGWTSVPSKCDGSSSIDGNITIDSGIYTGKNNQSIFISTGKNWVINEWDSCTIFNLTDNSFGKILYNSKDTIIAILNGGKNNFWNYGDRFVIRSGYPCMDQVGLAANQAHEPVYEWENYRNGQNLNFTVCTDGLNPIHIKEKRDFYNDTPRPNYTPYKFPHPFTIPSLVYPDNSAINIPTDVTVRWNAFFGATQYTLQASRDSLFSSLIITAINLTDTSFKLPKLDTNIYCYWRVIGLSGETVKDTSEARKFTTGNIVGISQNSLKKNRQISNFSFYPSIISSIHTSVNFYHIVKENRNFKLEIYNSLGRLVSWNKFRILCVPNEEEPMLIGSWDLRSRHGSKVSSGIYIPILKILDERNRTINVLKAASSINVTY